MSKEVIIEPFYQDVRTFLQVLDKRTCTSLA